jgi:glycosyltransferase involved in cell wall biosynthesis
MTVVPPFLPDVEEVEVGARVDLPADIRTTPYFLSVGRLELIKGLQDVIPLFDATMPAELWIAGSGDYQPTLRRLADGRRVRFLGTQNAVQLQSLYRSAIGVVMPSVCYEVFPMVVLESFREGTPIVARALGPFPEILARSEGGLSFSTPDELRAALTALATDATLRQSLGRNGERAFRTHWDESVSLERYFDVIRTVAGRRNARDVLDRLDAPSDTWRQAPVG